MRRFFPTLSVALSSSKGHALSFSTGQVVVHPHHGPATVQKISTRVIRNDRKQYLRLDVHHPALSVELPIERAEEIGVRPIMALSEVREILDLLLAPSEEQDSVWSRRIKSNTERLRSGNVRIIAGLVRDLTRRNEEKRLSFGEMTLLRDASAPLLAELTLVLAVPESEVEAMLNAAILDGTLPVLPEPELATAS